MKTLNDIKKEIKPWYNDDTESNRYYLQSGYLKKASAFVTEEEEEKIDSRLTYKVSGNEETFFVCTAKSYNGAVLDELKEMFSGYIVSFHSAR